MPNVKCQFDYKLCDKDGNLSSLPKDTTEKDLGIWFKILEPVHEISNNVVWATRRV